jgi:hypothetical protein
MRRARFLSACVALLRIYVKSTASARGAYVICDTLSGGSTSTIMWPQSDYVAFDLAHSAAESAPHSLEDSLHKLKEFM